MKYTHYILWYIILGVYITIPIYICPHSSSVCIQYNTQQLHKTHHTLFLVEVGELECCKVLYQRVWIIGGGLRVNSDSS